MKKKCYIIEKIDFSFIDEISQQLKKKNIPMINSNKKKINEKTDINEEIDNFSIFFKDSIEKNEFLQLTIWYYTGYVIEMHFCMTYYFIVPSFFFIWSNI